MGSASLATNATSILSLSVLPHFFSGPAGCLPIRGHPEAGQGGLLLFHTAVTVEGQVDCKVWQLQILWSKEAPSRVNRDQHIHLNSLGENKKSYTCLNTAHPTARDTAISGLQQPSRARRRQIPPICAAHRVRAAVLLDGTMVGTGKRCPFLCHMQPFTEISLANAAHVSALSLNTWSFGWGITFSM